MIKENTENYSSSKRVLSDQVHCERCGRRLSNPISMARQIGPVCFGRIQHALFHGSNYMLPMNGESIGHNKMLRGENIIDIKEKIN